MQWFCIRLTGEYISKKDTCTREKLNLTIFLFFNSLTTWDWIIIQQEGFSGWPSHLAKLFRKFMHACLVMGKFWMKNYSENSCMHHACIQPSILVKDFVELLQRSVYHSLLIIVFFFFFFSLLSSPLISFLLFFEA